MERKIKGKNVKKNNFILHRLGRGSFSSQRRGIGYFLQMTDVPRDSWLLFDQWCSGLYGSDLCAHLVVVKCEVSLLLLLGKYSYALGQQPS